MSSDKTDSYRVSFTYYFSPSSQHNANRADRISISLFPPPVCVLGVIQLILLFCSSLIFFSMPVFHLSLSKIKSFHPPPEKRSSLLSFRVIRLYQYFPNKGMLNAFISYDEWDLKTQPPPVQQQEVTDDLSRSQRLKTSRWQQLPSFA